jgi:Flp pilus assembly protein TadD
MPRETDGDSTLTLYRRGIELLEEEDFEEAAAPLEEAARRAPEKTSIREALGRAYFRSGRFAAAAVEFTAVVERARHHLALASNLQPDRPDYSFYRAML